MFIKHYKEFKSVQNLIKTFKNAQEFQRNQNQTHYEASMNQRLDGNLKKNLW